MLDYEFAVIHFPRDSMARSHEGIVTLFDTESSADAYAKLMEGKAYHVHSDGALTYTIATMGQDY
jgi:hypothetical protein